MISDWQIKMLTADSWAGEIWVRVRIPGLGVGGEPGGGKEGEGERRSRHGLGES